VEDEIEVRRRHAPSNPTAWCIPATAGICLRTISSATCGGRFVSTASARVP